MPELPNKRYLRRRAVRDYLGIDDDEFTKLVRAKVLKPYWLEGKGRAWFKREEVLKAEDDGRIFTAERTKR